MLTRRSFDLIQDSIGLFSLNVSGGDFGNLWIKGEEGA